MTPTYTITANGRDITPEIAPNFLGLVITDRVGISSDTFDLELNWDGGFAILPGTLLQVKIGFAETGTWDAGSYYVEEVSLSGPADTLQLRATSLPESPAAAVGALQGATDRTWQSGTTFYDIVEAVCRDANLEASVSLALAGIVMPFTAQINESDAEFLSRITILRDGLVKYHDREVVFEKKDVGLLDTFKLDKADPHLAYQLTSTDRDRIGSVTSKYQDVDAGDVKNYTAGAGKPKKIIRQTFPDRQSAIDAAESLLKHLQRRRVHGSVTLITAPGAFGGGEDGIDGVSGSVFADLHRIGSAAYFKRRVDECLSTPTTRVR